MRTGEPTPSRVGSSTCPQILPGLYSASWMNTCTMPEAPSANCLDAASRRFQVSALEVCELQVGFREACIHQEGAAQVGRCRWAPLRIALGSVTPRRLRLRLAFDSSSRRSSAQRPMTVAAAWRSAASGK